MLYGGNLITIMITREDKELKSDVQNANLLWEYEFDTIIEIGQWIHIIKNTDLEALEN